MYYLESHISESVNTVVNKSLELICKDLILTSILRYYPPRSTEINKPRLSGLSPLLDFLEDMAHYQDKVVGSPHVVDVLSVASFKRPNV